MNSRHRHGYIVWVFATATVIAASLFLYRIRPLAGIGFGSTAIGLAVLAHLGILAAVVGPLVAWRRRLTSRRK
jgi:hypothetical protein